MKPEMKMQLKEYQQFIETYLDTVANMSRLTICVGTGNNKQGGKSQKF